MFDLSTAEGREELEEAMAEVAIEETEAERDTLYVPMQGIFEFVVLSFTGILPGANGYDREKDRLMVGFRYGNKMIPSWFEDKKVPVSDVTAYDFLTDPRTGLRNGQTIAPHGSSLTDLERGIGDWADLPPLFVWKQGMWVTQAVFEPGFDIEELPSFIKTKVKKHLTDGWDGKTIPHDLFSLYLVSGEGTTGNNLYRVYELPSEMCGRDDPHHPLMWPERIKRPPYGSSAYKGESWRETTPAARAIGLGPTTPTTTTPKPPPIPAGVRYRCTGCGHWFSQSDLPGHAQVCGKGEDADWAMMCHGDCGCSTLDEASRPKPGFPRVTAPKVEEEGAAVDAGGSAPDPS